jgi:hypothetical protein
MSVEDVDECPMLTPLDVAGNSRGAPTRLFRSRSDLSRVVACHCGLHNADRLGGCVLSTEVDVFRQRGGEACGC